MFATALLLSFPQILQNESTDWNLVIANAAPAVVSVRSRIRIPAGRDEAGPFEGSGFIMDLANGLVATNRHVAGEGVVLDLEVYFYDGTAAPARLIYSDPLHDYAFLKIDSRQAPTGVTQIQLDPRAPAVGEEVRMIGNNGGLAATVLGGNISNLDAFWDQDPGVPYIQTSIASSGGSSGSPIIDRNGNAVGMQTAHDEHTSYALPAEYLDTACKRVLAGIAPPRGTIGLRLRRVEPAVALAAGAIQQKDLESWSRADAPKIAIIEGVVPGTPADGVLEPGDVVFSVQDVAAGDARSVELVLDRQVGRNVEILYAREGATKKVSMKVADLSVDCVQKLVLFGGASFHDMTFEIRSRGDINKKGVFVNHVEPGSAAEAAGIRRDDVIIQIGGKPVPDLEGFWTEVSNASHGTRLLCVLRRPSTFDSATRTVTLVTDRVWDPTRLIDRVDGRWRDRGLPGDLLEPRDSTPASKPPLRPGGASDSNPVKQGSVKR